MNPAIHAAIAAQQRRHQQEEEQMSGYNAADLEGWEFKIVRSATGRFRNSEVVKQLIAEEAQNGWEMLEKFDDYRIRFKRRIEKRALHSGGAIDPYRTQFGLGHWVGPIAGLVVALLVAGFALIASGQAKGETSPMPYVILGVIVLLAVVVVVMRLGRS